MEKIKLKDAEVWAEGNMLMIRMTGEATYDLLGEITRVSMDLVKKFRLKYVLVDSDVLKMSLSTRKSASGIQTMPVEKIALVCGNPVTRAIATFFLKGYGLKIPTRLFSSVEDAKKWFKEGA